MKEAGEEEQEEEAEEEEGAERNDGNGGKGGVLSEVTANMKDKVWSEAIEMKEGRVQSQAIGMEKKEG